MRVTCHHCKQETVLLPIGLDGPVHQDARGIYCAPGYVQPCDSCGHNLLSNAYSPSCDMCKKLEQEAVEWARGDRVAVGVDGE